jgi:hypothetical protein
MALAGGNSGAELSDSQAYAQLQMVWPERWQAIRQQLQ